MLRTFCFFTISWLVPLITLAQNAQKECLTITIPRMLNHRIPIFDTAFTTHAVKNVMVPIRGVINLESNDPRNSILAKTGASKIGYSLKADSTIGGIYLKFTPTEERVRELESIMGTPTILTTQGIGESFGVKGWNQSECSITLFMDGPYDWPVEVPQSVVLCFRSTKDIKNIDL